MNTSPVKNELEEKTWYIPKIRSLDFTLPTELEASEPPEARGLARDQVRLLVSTISDTRVIHTQFRQLPDYLNSGDALVINTSGTRNAAVPATGLEGKSIEIHVSTHLPGDLWVVEIRQIEGNTTIPFFEAVPGQKLALPANGSVTLHTPYRPEQRTLLLEQQTVGLRPPLQPEQRALLPEPADRRIRLWLATFQLPIPLQDYLEKYGYPIRYKYVKEGWPSSYYQTVYAQDKGSAEMPSAGRAFTPELLTQLIARGILILPVTLHTGVASLEEHEPPYEEYYRVPQATARAINMARAAGGRIIAVGTTVVRALESTADAQGAVHPGEGWTDLFITPERALKVVDGMLTGFHEPRSTHLAMLAALAGFEHLCQTYYQALEGKYLWHEFGDLHLILP
jgi:S-adenosylmethionine:tRNA ribosyltransferase-isomerase